MKGQKVKLDVYLRTCAGQNVHPDERFMSLNREDLIAGCFRSLVRSLKAAEDRADILLTVIDDHSTSSFIARLSQILREGGVHYKLISLSRDETGASALSRAVHQAARESARELVYFVEDDYLHSAGAISEMLDAHREFSFRLGGAEVAIFPVDYPDFYTIQPQPTRIVTGAHRHFRTVKSSTRTFLLSKKLFMSEWDTFAASALIGLANEISEEATIHRIWHKEKVFLFAPIPTLALPVQSAPKLPPFTDWKMWWKLYAG